MSKCHSLSGSCWYIVQKDDGGQKWTAASKGNWSLKSFVLGSTKGLKAIYNQLRFLVSSCFEIRMENSVKTGSRTGWTVPKAAVCEKM